MQIIHSLASSSLFSTSTLSLPSLLPPQIIQSTSKTTRPAISLHFHFNSAAKSPILTPQTHASSSNPNNNDTIDPTITTKDLHLLDKPTPSPTTSTSPTATDDNQDKQEPLAPFLKFFTSTQDTTTSPNPATANQIKIVKRDGSKCYDPKPGDLAVGVVVSGDENKLDLEIAADELGLMLTKDVLPFHTEETLSLVCDIHEDIEKFAVAGRFGIVKDEEAFRGGERRVAGRPVVDVGGIVFAEVLGRTLSGRPLLSARRVFRRVAWHRVRQVLPFPFFSALWMWFALHCGEFSSMQIVIGGC